MDTHRTLAAWILFVVMAVAAAFFWHQSDERGRHIAELKMTIDNMDKRLDAFGQAMQTLKNQMSETEARMRQVILSAQSVNEVPSLESVPSLQAPTATSLPAQ